MPSTRGRTEPRIIPSADCGNSPKNTLLQDITIALVRRDVAFLSRHVTDDIRWEMIGAPAVEGRAAFEQVVRTNSDVTQLTIEHVMSHGRVGAVNGAVARRDATHDFCNVYEFANAKAERVKSIKSYVIEHGDA